MTARQPNTAYSKTTSSAGVLLIELEMPKTMAFQAFEEQLENQLAKLETQFSDFVTRNSFSGSIGR
ncbi:MAG TPA: hypothetical protein VMM76_12510 [Pirellulaceae bacterium]|nr:hypothetical protein [Pirellulaceae bacterium]